MDWFKSAYERLLKWKQQEKRYQDVAPVLALARQEALRLDRNFIGTEHLLLGLLASGQGAAFEVLRQNGLDLETSRTEVERCFGRGDFKELFPQVPYTPRAKSIVERAWREAQALQRDSMQPEHLLLALLCEDEGPAAKILQKFKVDLEATRQALRMRTGA